MIQYFAWFTQFWRQRKAVMTGVVLLTIFTTAIKTVLPILLAGVVDALAPTAGKESAVLGFLRSFPGFTIGTSYHDTVIALITIYFIVAILAEIVARVLPLARTYLNLVFAAMMRNTYFDVFTRRNSRFFRTFRTGDLTSRLTDDIDGQWDRLGWYSGSGIMRPLEAFLILGMTLTAMASYSWELTLWSFLPMPFLIVLLARTEDRMVAATDAKQESVSECYDALESCFSGIRIVKSTQSEKNQLERYQEVLQRRVKREKEFLYINQLLTFLSMLVNHTGTIIVIFVGSYMTINHSLTLGQFLLFIVYLERLVEPIWTLSWFYASSRQTFRYVDRLRETETANYMEHGAQEHAPQSEKDTAPEEFQTLEFNRVSFRYLPESNRNTLDDISFTLRSGELLAIVGPVGAGKTTLLELIAGHLQATEGTVLLNGRDIASRPASEVARMVGYIRQESVLFSETVADNIRLGDTFDDAAIDSALGTAMLARELQFFPQGVHTILGQRGLSLSGGQKQRLSIARTLVRKPSLLLMDDCTAAMDARTEAEFWAAFKRELPGTTCIIVTHRMATARQADRILVFDKGILREQGSHAELKSRNGFYNRFMAHRDIEERLAE
jgi:ATP-binding cassette subfamily B multidrug efflux pump